MSRLLFILALAVVVYLLLKSHRTGISRAEPPASVDKQRPTEDMVRCSYCGVHLPRSEAIMAGGKFYCSDAHRRAQQSPPTDRDAG